MQVRVQLMLKFQHYNIILKAMNIKKLSWAKHGGKFFLEKCVAQANRTCDEAGMSLFKAFYFLRK